MIGKANRWVAAIFTMSAFLGVGLYLSGCGQNASKDAVTVVDETDHPFEATTEAQSPAMIEILTDTSATVTEAATAAPESAPTVQVYPSSPEAITVTPAAAPSIPAGEITFEKKVQIALTKAGYYKGAVDGKVGQDTRDAIRAFQRAEGLRADGMVGTSTWEKLKTHYSDPE